MTPSLAYIVQLDLPGHPVKIGQSRNPQARFDAFNAGTPVAVRWVGITINGVEREREMLAATASAKIKGEWRYPTTELIELVGAWAEAREWYAKVDNYAEHYERARVRDRIIAVDPTTEQYIRGRPSPRVPTYYWAKKVLKAAQIHDPTLILDWNGLVAAETAPDFRWPSHLRAAA